MTIQNAYRFLGKESTFYDGMITCSTLPGRAVCGLVWNMGREKNAHYLEKTLSGIPDGFSGKLLEVPVGTGVLTMPVYKTLPQADIICLDYAPDMMAAAQRRAGAAVPAGRSGNSGIHGLLHLQEVKQHQWTNNISVLTRTGSMAFTIPIPPIACCS